MGKKKFNPNVAKRRKWTLGWEQEIHEDPYAGKVARDATRTRDKMALNPLVIGKSTPVPMSSNPEPKRMKGARRRLKTGINPFKEPYGGWKS